MTIDCFLLLHLKIVFPSIVSNGILKFVFYTIDICNKFSIDYISLHLQFDKKKKTGKIAKGCIRSDISWYCAHFNGPHSCVGVLAVFKVVNV